jgi:hypothetical protein
MMAKQRIQFGFDTDAVWQRVKDRLSIFLDSNCWIAMADEAGPVACRIRSRLQSLVRSGQVFCPLSWGVLEELFKQSGPSLAITAGLMEELSLNAVFVMRTELYAWELERSMRRLNGIPDPSLQGLFVPPAAFAGSAPAVSFDLNVPISEVAAKSAQSFMRQNLSKIGVKELASKLGGRKLEETPPAYSSAAKNAMDRFKGNKAKLFLEEAGECFRMYITPLLQQRYSAEQMIGWLAQFATPGDEAAFFAKALAELPALHNFIDVMVVADSQPRRKDHYNDFMDNEIMVAPLVYADVFASLDKGIRDILRSRTKILSRTKCQYLDSLESLDARLTDCERQQ